MIFLHKRTQQGSSYISVLCGIKLETDVSLELSSKINCNTAQHALNQNKPKPKIVFMTSYVNQVVNTGQNLWRSVFSIDDKWSVRFLIVNRIVQEMFAVWQNSNSWTCRSTLLLRGFSSKRSRNDTRYVGHNIQFISDMVSKTE